MDKLIVVAIGGAIGSVLRFLIGVYLAKIINPYFPYGTLAVNTIGSFMLSLLMILSLEKLSLNPLWRLFLAVGLMGGFTTFSSFTYETLSMFMEGNYIKGFFNIFLNFTFSFLFAFLGIILGKLLSQV